MGSKLKLHFWSEICLKNGDLKFTTISSPLTPGEQTVKRLSTMMQETQVDPGGKVHWRKDIVTPVLCPGKSHGQRALRVSCSPCGRKESDTRLSSVPVPVPA